MTENETIAVDTHEHADRRDPSGAAIAAAMRFVEESGGMYAAAATFRLVQQLFSADDTPEHHRAVVAAIRFTECFPTTADAVKYFQSVEKLLGLARLHEREMGDG